MDGVLNIRKPSGWTSHDVVAAVRRLLNEKRIGHLGTLDPLATGVLPLAVGTATRLVEYASYDKEYAAVCLLGRTTDTFDITGKTLAETPTEGLAAEAVRKAVMDLVHVTEQEPPMVSAVKLGGRKLYELAREGITVERKPRPVRIREVEVLSVELPRATFRVVCSPGTYVRVLCRTLGEALGVGACMETLERTRVGPFLLKDSLDLDAVKNVMENGGVSGMLLPSSRLAAHFPEVQVGNDGIKALCLGQKVRTPQAPPGLVRVLNPGGRLSAVGEVGTDGMTLSPRKVFGVEGIL